MASPTDVLNFLRAESSLLVESVRNQPDAARRLTHFIREEVCKRYPIRGPEVEILDYLDGRIAAPREGDRFLILIVANVRIQGVKWDRDTGRELGRVRLRGEAHANGTATRTDDRYENFSYTEPSDFKLVNRIEEK